VFFGDFNFNGVKYSVRKQSEIILSSLRLLYPTSVEFSQIMLTENPWTVQGGNLL